MHYVKYLIIVLGVLCGIALASTFTNNKVCGWEGGKSWPCLCLGSTTLSNSNPSLKIAYCTGLNLSCSSTALKFNSFLDFNNAEMPLSCIKTALDMMPQSSKPTKTLDSAPKIEEKYYVVSPNGEYKLSIESLSGECTYKLKSVTNDAINFGSSIGCTVVPVGGMSGYVSNLVVWLDNTHVFLNDPTARKLILISINNTGLQTDTINYSGIYAEVVGVSNDSSKILWGSTYSTSNPEYLYTLTDINLKVLKTVNVDQANLESLSTLFVPDSNGVLFLKKFETADFTPASVISLIDENNGCQCKPEDPGCTLQWFEFDYFNFDTQVLKTVLLSSKDLATECGRGCYGPLVVDADDKNITLKFDCGHVDKKFYDEKGQINLNLP